MRRRDEGLERLLDLDGFLAEVGGGFWVKIIAQRVPVDNSRPHGVTYTLTLHDPAGRRVFGIDNAHAVRLTSGPAGRHRYAIMCIVAIRCGAMSTGTPKRCLTTSGARSRTC